jgi:hypothetical protein
MAHHWRTQPALNALLLVPATGFPFAPLVLLLPPTHTWSTYPILAQTAHIKRLEIQSGLCLFSPLLITHSFIHSFMLHL